MNAETPCSSFIGTIFVIRSIVDEAEIEKINS